MGKIDYNYSNFSDYVEYSENSITNLVRKNTNKPIGYFDRESNGRPKAIRVNIKGIKYLAHRIIWVLLNGVIDENLTIDHIDGNPFNNRKDNLRLVTRKINQRNRKLMKNNTTGECGIAYHKTGNNSGGYNEYIRAVWVNTEGKQCKKDFNLKTFNSFEDGVNFAKNYRLSKIEDKHTYTERHGK